MTPDPNAADAKPRFRWPPKPIEDIPPLRARIASERQPPPRRHATHRQPAATTNPPSDTTHPRTSLPPSRSSTLAIVHAIEQTFFGWSSAPMRVRLADAQWHPDDPGRYCPRCARTLAENTDACAVCRDKRLAWRAALRLGSYDSVLGELIREVKFSKWRRLGHDLGHMLGQVIRDRLEVDRIPPSRAILVPVPMSFRRRLARGIDHAAVLARGASSATGLPIVPILARRHGPPQVGLTGRARLRNVAGVFSRTKELPPSDDQPALILIDDVMTTGATLTAASRALIANPVGARPWIIVAPVAVAEIGPRNPLPHPTTGESEK